VGGALRRVLVVSADRSEHGLLEPVHDELANRDDVLARWCLLDSRADPASNLLVYREALEDFQPHLIVLPTDRNEIVYAAAYSFHKGYVIAHFHAGNNSANHPDDINRRVISHFSHILLCNMEEHRQNLISQGEDEWRIHVVGSTAFDNLKYDDSILPNAPFDLVILHPNPLSEEETKKDLSTAIAEVLHSGRYAIWVYPNHDKNCEPIIAFLNKLSDVHVMKYQSLPRPQYLSLLKNCKRAVGNTSSFYYELPILNPNAQLVQIGERNKGLTVPQTEMGGAKRIADLLASIEIDEKLRVKRMHLP
jgi:GDP/UDP-N,N'-diacetylbacillosamine 2-epimerase (hydrolysing)